MIFARGEAAAGVYSVAQNVLNIVNYATTAVMALLLPVIADALAGRRSKKFLKSKARVLSRGLVVFSALGVVLFATFGDVIVSVFGDGFQGAVLPLVIMGIGGAIGLLFGFPITVLTLSADRGSFVWVFAATLMLSLVLSVLMIVWLGLVGGAIATGVANVLSRLIFHVLCVRKTGISTAVI